jgi:hypothetical protein
MNHGQLQAPAVRVFPRNGKAAGHQYIQCLGAIAYPEQERAFLQATQFRALRNRIELIDFQMLEAGNLPKEFE